MFISPHRRANPACGSQTTALLSHTVYFLAIHPDVLKKAREEILDALGPEGAPTVEKMRGLKYRKPHRSCKSKSTQKSPLPYHPVRAVLNETLRLFTPLPSSIRDTRDKGVALPRSDETYNSVPMYVPPGTPVLTMPYLMQRNKVLWGPDAEEFKPDRWFDPALQQKLSANSFIFVPFATGPRNVSHLTACFPRESKR